jgi:hypothetical protein
VTQSVQGRGAGRPRQRLATTPARASSLGGRATIGSASTRTSHRNDRRRRRRPRLGKQLARLGSWWSFRPDGRVQSMWRQFPGSARVSVCRPGGILRWGGIAQKECSYAQTGACWLAACWDAVRHRRDFGSCVCLVLSRIWLRLRLACLWLWVFPLALTLVLRTQVRVWRRFLSPTSLGLARLGVSGLGMGWAALGWLATLVGLLIHADGPGFERA